MYFEEAFKKIKTALEKADVKPADGHFAIQVRMTDDDCGGIFYIEQTDKQYFVEPYDYYDNDVDVAANYKIILSMAQGKLDIETAIAEGTVYAGGNTDAFIAFAKSITPKKAAKKAPAKKTADKKTAAKKTAEKTAKKTAEKKTAAKNPAPKKAEEKPAKVSKAAPAPKTETIEKAVKKETEAAPVAKEKKSEKPKETIAQVVEKESKPKKKAEKASK